jgi:hypothetical protein
MYTDAVDFPNLSQAKVETMKREWIEELLTKAEQAADEARQAASKIVGLYEPRARPDHLLEIARFYADLAKTIETSQVAEKRKSL